VGSYWPSVVNQVDFICGGFMQYISYLQINEIIKPNKQEPPGWLYYHPHVTHKNTKKYINPNNTAYIAKTLFEYFPHFIKNGSISFAFAEDLFFTKKRQPYRSLWKLPIELYPRKGIELSYNKIENWSIENNKAILKSASSGQEFVYMDANEIVENWCIDIIKNHPVTD